MKLYTEEQMRKTWNAAYTDALDMDEEEPKFFEDFIESLTPIELPSDEEINERSYYDKDNDKLIVNAAEIARFRDGAKWLRDKILNQNK